MADRPAAEVHVDVALVRRLLEGQCPVIDGVGRVADLPLRVVSEGWDNVMLRLGEHLAVRVPRRSLAAGLVVTEQRWLAQVAELVDLRVPAAVVAGRPTPFFPWHWSVVPWIDGVAAGTLPRARRGAIAEPLARFVTQLHRPAPADGPVNPLRGGPLSGRDTAVRERLAGLRHPRARELGQVWDRALAAPVWDGPPSWVHGDLHPFNVVVGEGRAVPSPLELRAVVDFGDMTSGDPACDLAAAWLTFDAEGRATFRAAVDAAGRTDEAMWDRARGWAVSMATSLLAHSDDDPTFAALGDETTTELLT